jgi:hypothetical protein
MKHWLVAIAMAVVGVAGAADAQSLAELARREEARRKAIPTPAKVYTNEDIRGRAVPAPPPQASPGPAAAAAPAPTGPGKAGEPAAAPTPPQGQAPGADEVKGEAYWRKRIQAERDALARAQMFAEALQSRINALSADFVARDDPAQRAVIATDRQKALAELDRVKQEIAQFAKGITAIQEEARRAGVPPGWLR